MIKISRKSFVLLFVLLIYIVFINLFSLTKLNKLEKYIEQINVTIDCPHSNTDVINVYCIQNKEEFKETNEKDIENIEDEENDIENDIINLTIEDENSSINFNYSEEEINKICCVVEAETHGADMESKIHIVHVILNRVNSSNFPDNVIEVCNQSNQFASRSDIEQSTIDAVYTALSMADTTQGALFFHSGDWVDTFFGANYLFTDDVGHHFYK